MKASIEVRTSRLPVENIAHDHVTTDPIRKPPVRGQREGVQATPALAGLQKPDLELRYYVAGVLKTQGKASTNTQGGKSEPLGVLGMSCRNPCPS